MSRIKNKEFLEGKLIIVNVNSGENSIPNILLIYRVF